MTDKLIQTLQDAVNDPMWPDQETKVRLGMILLGKWRDGSSPGEIVDAFLDALKVPEATSQMDKST
jgi:hypothetical protein